MASVAFEMCYIFNLGSKIFFLRKQDINWIVGFWLAETELTAADLLMV